MNRIRMYSLLACALWIGGCAVGPDYKPPIVKVNPQFGELNGATTQPSQTDAAAVPSGKWWTAFGDPQLNRLIDSALKDNLDMQEAQSRLREARYEMVEAGAMFYPQI